MNRCLPLLLFCATVAVGASIQAPRAGTVRYADGSVYPMIGVSRALIAGQPLAADASAAAFSDAVGIVAVESGLEIVDFSGSNPSRWDGDSRNAVLAMQDDPSCAMAWLPASNSIVTFAAGAWRTTMLTAPLPGNVVAVRRASKDTAHLLISEGDQVFELTVGFASGNVLLQRLIPDAKMPATYLADGLLFQDGDLLVYESAAAGRKTLRFDGRMDAFEQMSGHAVHAVSKSSDAHWLVELARGNGLALSQLPAPAVSLAGGAR